MRRKQSDRIGKEREESGMVGHARMSGRMDHCFFKLGTGKQMKNRGFMSGNDSSEE